MSSKMKSWFESLVWTIVVVLIIRALFIQAYEIPTGSMEDTLLPGDFLLVAKFTYGIQIPYTHVKILDFHRPDRKDVVVFNYPLEPKKDFVKRCIGLPGDTIEIKNKVVYINGKPLDEPYVVHKDPRVFPPLMDLDNPLAREEYQRAWVERRFMGQNRVRDNFGPVVVPQGNIFVMGDNRDYSLDSRFWGPLPMKFLKGSPLIIYFSWDKEQPLYAFWKKIRWGRLFRILLWI